MLIHWQLVAMIAPSGALTWGLVGSKFGLALGLIGALVGGTIGVLGAWLLSRQHLRAETSGHLGIQWGLAILLLFLLFVILVLVPSVLAAAW